jgi:hypothetical protein
LKGWKDFVIDAIGLATFGIGRSATLLGRLGTARPFMRAADNAFDTGTDALGAMNRARAGQQALNARPNLRGLRVPNPNRPGQTLTGAAARSTANAQYNAAQRAAGTQYRTATNEYWSQIDNYNNIRYPAETPWTGWSNAGSYAGQNAVDAVRPLWTQGPFGFTGVVTEIGIGTGIGVYQTIDAGNNMASAPHWPWNR